MFGSVKDAVQRLLWTKKRRNTYGQPQSYSPEQYPGLKEYLILELVESVTRLIQYELEGTTDAANHEREHLEFLNEEYEQLAKER